MADRPSAVKRAVLWRALAAIIVGGLAGMGGLTIRGHGGPILPTIVLSAPAVLLCSFAFEENNAYAMAVVVGTGLWYGLAVAIVSVARNWKTPMFLLIIHLTCIAILFVLAAQH